MAENWAVLGTGYITSCPEWEAPWALLFTHHQAGSSRSAMGELQMPVVLDNNYSNSFKINKIRFSTVLVTHSEHRGERRHLPPLLRVLQSKHGTDASTSFSPLPLYSLFSKITVPSPLNTIYCQLQHKIYFLKQCTMFYCIFLEGREEGREERRKDGRKEVAEGQGLCRKRNVDLVYVVTEWNNEVRKHHYQCSPITFMLMHDHHIKIQNSVSFPLIWERLYSLKKTTCELHLHFHC